MVFLKFNDGPKNNVYVAPSGQTYYVFLGVRFEVLDERDIAYFEKKSTVVNADQVEIKKAVKKKSKKKAKKSKKKA